MNVISAKDVSKTFDNFTLEHVSLQLQKGVLYGILGPNGSGKSTLIKILTGQLLPTTGEISVLGINPKTHPIELKANLGIIPEQETPPSFLTVQEYLHFVCKIRNIEFSKLEFFYKLVDLMGNEHILIKDLSRGNKQKLLFIQAFIHSPKVVFIDEPLINLDPLVQKKVKEFLKQYVKKGNTVVLSTHILSIAQEICDEVCILQYGKNKYQGSVKSIVQKHKSLEDYFVTLMTQKETKKHN